MRAAVAREFPRAFWMSGLPRVSQEERRGRVGFFALIVHPIPFLTVPFCSLARFSYTSSVHLLLGLPCQFEWVPSFRNQRRRLWLILVAYRVKLSYSQVSESVS